MSKLIIHPNSRAVPCNFCGLNTALLPDNQKAQVENKVCCRQCKENGRSKMHINPGDFYSSKFNPQKPGNDTMDQVRKEIICNNLPKIEIARLHGEYSRKDTMYLDLIYDNENDKPYFRMLIIDDDDAFFGTEVYNYIDAEDVHGLLIKNGIDLFEGMTEQNWKSYIWFAEN